MYFLIRTSEDGEVSIAQYTEQQLRKAMKDEDDPIDLSKAASTLVGGLHDLASGSEPLIIIKGELIVPKAKQKVIEWEF